MPAWLANEFYLAWNYAPETTIKQVSHGAKMQYHHTVVNSV